jgi:hypothetical protein
VFDQPVIARCQLHKIRNVTDKSGAGNAQATTPHRRAQGRRRRPGQGGRTGFRYLPWTSRWRVGGRTRRLIPRCFPSSQPRALSACG